MIKLESSQAREPLKFYLKSTVHGKRVQVVRLAFIVLLDWLGKPDGLNKLNIVGRHQWLLEEGFHGFDCCQIKLLDNQTKYFFPGRSVDCSVDQA